jgi:hypothetical protein
MNRAHMSFPVSSPEGTGNRETDTNALTDSDLQFPKGIGQRPASGKLKTRRYHVADSGRAASRTDAPSLTIGRLYQPQTAALDDLVDVLHELLTDSQESPNARSSAGPESTCFPSAPE